jgi:cytochrome subunit of sulfide dehydrogenase
MKTRKIRARQWRAIFIVGMALSGAQALAQTPPAQPAADTRPQDARVLTANCANCHGTNGNNAGNFFRLAGQPKDYIVTQMQAFKAGTRQATIMHQLAKGYTDEQIILMAEYFARQKAN